MRSPFFLGLKVPIMCQENLTSPNRNLTALFAVTWTVLGRGGWYFCYTSICISSLLLHVWRLCKGWEEEERRKLKLHVISFGDALENWLTQATMWNMIFVEVVIRNVYCLIPIDREEVIPALSKALQMRLKSISSQNLYVLSYLSCFHALCTTSDCE